MEVRTRFKGEIAVGIYWIIETGQGKRVQETGIETRVPDIDCVS